MPPKRKAASTKAKTSPVKKVKKEEVVEEAVTKDNIVSKLKEADKQTNKVKRYLPDKLFYGHTNYTVYQDYDCTLNQTNIGANNNKFYIIQILLSASKQIYFWNRYGRVGERGVDNGLEYCADEKEAVKKFEKKFKDKTGNNWADRAKFVKVAKKYDLLEMDTNSEDPEEETVKETKEMQASKLDGKTQKLINLIFDKDMFNSALKKYDLDVKKMPLGKLSKTQIAKGFEVLENIELELNKKSPNNKNINELSSKFYTVIPQDFGRSVPKPISTTTFLQEKYDMLIVLSDIEMAQSLKENNSVKIEADTKPPNILDINYESLKCKLTLLDKNSEEFKIIDKYTDATKASFWRSVEILEVWRVDREEEEARFKEFKGINNRKLLWHGTNVAVVAAILKSGLRIMPHSGGRVGRGIYFASENSKSAGYVGTTQYDGNQVGIMFLNEVVLGKEHHILRDDSSLVCPPNGFDSVIADGQTEPDSSEDAKLELDGKPIVVPQGKPKARGIQSSFSQSEYLIYKENQNRIRYLLKMKF